MRPTFCPQCKEPLSRPRGAAPLVCPICATVIAPEPAAFTDVPPSPAGERRADEPKRRPAEPCVPVNQPLGPGWRTVYVGLGLIKWGTVAALAALAFNLVVVLAASDRTAARANLPTEERIGALAIIVPSGLAVALSLLGRLFCCWAPAGSGARLPAALAFLGTLLAQLLAAFVLLNTMLVELHSTSPVLLLPVELAAGVVSLAAEATFLVFLYQVGRFLQAPEVGRRVLRLVIVAVLVVVGVTFGVLVLVLGAAPFESAAPPPSGPQAVAGRVLGAWLAVVFGAALVLMQYFDLINVTRHALARRFSRDAAAGQPQTA